MAIKLTDLSLNHQKFALSYLDSGNATQAYLQMSPAVSYGTARANGSQLLAKASVATFLSQEIQKRYVRHAHSSREALLERAYNDEMEARKDKKWASTHKFLDLQAKLRGFYNEAGSDGSGFRAIVNQISITNSPNNNDNVTVQTVVERGGTQGEAQAIDSKQ